MLERLRAGARFARRVPRFLAQTLDRDAARALVTAQLAQRADGSVRILAGAVFARPQSVYARLLAHAGIGPAEAEQLVASDGLEGALERLHAAGVYVTLEELKGRRPLRRGSLEIATVPADFDNPLLAASYEARSWGSRGAGTRVLVDLDLLAYEAAHQALFATEFALYGCVAGQWRPVPPGIAGINNALRSARIGEPLARWFSQTDPARAGASDALLLRYLVRVGLDEYRCGCGFERLGLARHLHTIRSFEKLTSEGMSFLGSDLLRLVEEVLPQRFGGDATRYQLVEDECDTPGQGG